MAVVFESAEVSAKTSLPRSPRCPVGGSWLVSPSMDFWLALLALALSFASSLRAGWQLARGEFHRGHFNLAALGLAFAALFGTLCLRGQVEGGCPLNGPTDLLLFLAWGILGFYLIAGPALRMSLLGYFTAPLACGLQAIALWPGVWQAATPQPERSGWIEAHASLSMLAYAGFGLAAVAGIMFLLLDRQLKQHSVKALGWKLPPLHHLADALVQLLWWSLILLSAGILFGLVEWRWQLNPKIASALGVWLWFLAALLLRWRGRLHSRRLAQVAVSGFLLALISLWLVERTLQAMAS